MSTTVAKQNPAKRVPPATTGRLFFLDLSAGRVLTANPDGSDLKVIVSEGRRLPDGIVVDEAAGHIYWTNMGNPSANDGSIERADLDGKSVTHIIPPGGTFTPKQLQLDKKNGKLYWSDREGMRGKRKRKWGLETAIAVAAASFIGHRKGLTMPAKAASSVPIWKSLKARLLPTGKILNSFLMAFLSRLIWIWILPTGSCIGQIVAIHHAATR